MISTSGILSTGEKKCMPQTLSGRAVAEAQLKREALDVMSERMLIQRLKELEAMEQTGGFEGRTKKEILMLTREKTKLEKTLGGIRDMTKVPSAIWVVDTKKEHIAVNEARKLGIPVVAMVEILGGCHVGSDRGSVTVREDGAVRDPGRGAGPVVVGRDHLRRAAVRRRTEQPAADRRLSAVARDRAALAEGDRSSPRAATPTPWPKCWARLTTCSSSSSRYSSASCSSR